MLKTFIKITIRLLVAYAILVVVNRMLIEVSDIGSLTPLVTFPFVAVYLLRDMGFPGLFVESSACDFYWCGLTLLGSLAMVVFWLLVILLLAWIISLVSSKGSAGG